MDNHLQQTTNALSRFPAVLDALLRDLPEAGVLQDEGEGTWTVGDVVRHLVYLERTDWMPRVRTVLESGQSRPFEPVDREGYLRDGEALALTALLDRFAHLRARNVEDLRMLNLQQHDLERTGKHPALGVVTLSQLLATWAVHDLTHLHQISRLLARPFADAVGPWRAYLGVLQCEAHGSR